MGGEGGTVRRDILLAVIIALGVAAAFAMDTGLECRVQRDLVRADPRLEPVDRARPAAPAAKGSEADAPVGITSLTNP